MGGRVVRENHEGHSSDAQLVELARTTLARQALPGPADEALVPVLAARFAAALAYHRAQFHVAGKPDDAATVMAALGRGEFAFGRRSDVNLWDDLALAVLLGRCGDAGVERFRTRFAGQVAAWAKRYARREGVTLEDFVADLLLPREAAPPRIESYHGQGPLDGWLRQVFISLCHKRRQKGLVERQGHARGGQRSDAIAGDAGPDNGLPNAFDQVADPEDQPDERYARYECAEKLAPVIAECVARVPQDQRLVLQMAVVDDVPQKRLAQLFGVPEYKITRLKQAAIKTARAAFSEIARRVSKLTDEAARRCVELLLERFPAA